MPIRFLAAALRLLGAGIAAASWRARIALVLALAAAVAGGYFLYLRDSSLVAVTDVEVVGVYSGEPRQIIGEFDSAAREMTTLHVDHERLDEIAAAHPTIASVSADPNFPHGLRIEIQEHEPVLIARWGGHVVAVAGDGSLLAGIQLPEEGALPTLELEQAPDGDRLTGVELDQAIAVGAAPEPLRPLVEQVGHSKEFGVELVLRGGIPVRFGTGTRAAEKWRAAAAVLADGKLDALTYVDVRVPERPAAGGAATSLAPADPPA
jgi:cell division protein FtsQ